MKVLVIQTSFPGDTILASSLLETLHVNHPQAEIHFLLRKGNESLYDHHPFLKKVWVWDKAKKFASALSLIRSFRKEKFDLIVNVQRFFMTGAISLLSGAKKTIGFDKNPLSFLFSKKVNHKFENGLHEINRNYWLIEDFNPIFKKPKLYPKEISVSQTPYVVLAPASVWFTKQWPESYWIELGRLLNGEFEVILMGGPADRELCERITEGIGSNAFNFAGKYSLLDSAGIIKNAEVIVCNDSAPAHLATAVNTPTLQLYCSTTPLFGFSAMADKHIILETELNLNCRPCNNHGKAECPLKHFDCGLSILPKKAYEALNQLL